MSDGFLGRWSKRKLDAKDGRSLPPEPAEIAPPEAGPAEIARTEAGSADASLRPPAVVALDEAATPAAAAVDGGQPAAAQEQSAEPLPTLEDVRALTRESDFSRFAARDVTPEVRNAAMKKLFTDPRYNVMDGMDVYIDDYSRPDPIPESMLRQLAGAAFLRLFDEEPPKDQQAAAQTRDVADNPAPQSVAQSADSAAVPEPDHADPDLRLQQDDAAPGPGPGPGVV
jgi:hypothetical protein